MIKSIDEEGDQESSVSKLWGAFPSVGLTLIAYGAMEGLYYGIVLILFLFTKNIEITRNIVNGPLFLTMIYTIELLLIIFPVWYIGRYLQDSSLKNRLTTLGFTTKGYDRKGILNEILIGLFFAVELIMISIISTRAIEEILRFFGIKIITNLGSFDSIIKRANEMILILLIIMMILIVAPCEEILFRGFMQRGLVRNLGEKWGVLITAFVFALVHLILVFVYIFEPIKFFTLFILLFVPYIVLSFTMGLLFRWRNENLIANIIAHSGYNTFVILLYFLFFLF